MTFGRIKKIIKLAIWQYKDPYYQGVAPQLAFYLFLSIFPTLILLSQLLGLISLSLNMIEEWANFHVSGEGTQALLNIFSYSPSGANSIFLAIIAIWAASKMQFALIRVTNYTLTDGKTTGEGYLKDRIRAVKTMLITIFTIAFSLIALVYGPIIIKFVVKFVLGDTAADLAWLALRWPLSAGLYFFMISYMYYVLPTNRVPYRDIIPGSIFASMGFLIVTFGFYIYTQHSANYDIIYGSISNIVILVLWFWLMGWVITLGVTLNRLCWATRKENPIPISKDARLKRVTNTNFNLEKEVKKWKNRH